MGKTENAGHKNYIVDTLHESSKVLSSLVNQVDDIKAIADKVIEALKKGNKLVLFGNGGSAADAQHIATELVGGFTNHRRKSLPALALTTDTSTLTAIGNDYDFDSIFSRQAEALVNPGDVVFAISTSGNSMNVVRGAQASRDKGAFVVGLTGEKGGELKKNCHMMCRIPSENTAYIQQAHITVGHILCALVEKELAQGN